MSESVDRDEIIRLLEALGSEDDAAVLEAARTLHAQVADAGQDWDDLLVTQATAIAEDEDEPDADADDEPPVASGDAPAGGKKSKDDETLELIEKLLASRDRSEALREELEEYKADIANGDFAARDHQYVRALYNRLSK